MDHRHNQGPPLNDALTLDEAQALPDVGLRPSHVQRHCGPGSPLRKIVGLGKLGPIGRWTLLECGHWREIWCYDLIPLHSRHRAKPRERPTRARCGCCRLGYLPAPADKAQADQLAAKAGTT